MTTVPALHRTAFFELRCPFDELASEMAARAGGLWSKTDETGDGVVSAGQGPPACRRRQ